MLRASPKVYILIDALDECPEPTRYSQLYTFLNELVSLGIGGLRLLMTSQPLEDIRAGLTSILQSGLRISLHDVAAQSADLELYISDRLSNFKWPDEIKDEARSALISKADGMSVISSAFTPFFLVLNSCQVLICYPSNRGSPPLPSDGCS